jgi:hypothetical protein
MGIICNQQSQLYPTWISPEIGNTPKLSNWEGETMIHPGIWGVSDKSILHNIQLSAPWHAGEHSRLDGTWRDELRWNQNASDYEALTGNLRSVEHWGAWPKWQHSSRSIQPSTPSSFKQEPVCGLKPNLHNLITVAGDACALALYFCGPCQWSPYARTTPIPRAQQAFRRPYLAWRESALAETMGCYLNDPQ